MRTMFLLAAVLGFFFRAADVFACDKESRRPDGWVIGKVLSVDTTSKSTTYTIRVVDAAPGLPDTTSFISSGGATIDSTGEVILCSTETTFPGFEVTTIGLLPGEWIGLTYFDVGGHRINERFTISPPQINIGHTPEGRQAAEREIDRYMSASVNNGAKSRLDVVFVRTGPRPDFLGDYLELGERALPVYLPMRLQGERLSLDEFKNQ